MATRILTIGCSGPDVASLQIALAAANKAPQLVDGVYGQATVKAARRFQRAHWLVADGIAGPCTQNALYGDEAYNPILWSVNFIPQLLPTVCWAASTAMMTNATVHQVVTRTPDDLINDDVSLKTNPDAADAFINAKRFADANGIRLVCAATWPTLAFLRATLTTGPVMLDMLWDAGSYVSGEGSPGHMIVVVGMRGDDDPSGRGTTLHVFDPWPPHVGKRYSVNFFQWINEVKLRTHHMYQR